MHDVLMALDLPPAVKVQTIKLLARIGQTASADELWRASDRAAGFVLGLEIVGALDSTRIDSLYSVFDEAATARRLEHAQ